MEKRREVKSTFYTYNYCPHCNIIMGRTFINTHDPLHPLKEYTCSQCNYSERSIIEYPIVSVTFKEELDE